VKTAEPKPRKPRAVVRPCDEPDGTRTWDVEVDGRTVQSTIRTRAEARAEARALNNATQEQEP
jgi:hypothetical protein